MIKPIEQEASIWKTDWPIAAPKEPFTTEVYRCHMDNYPWNRYEYWYQCRVGWSGFSSLDTHEKYKIHLSQSSFGVVVKNFSDMSTQININLRCFFTNDIEQEGQDIGRTVSGGTQSVQGNKSRKFILQAHKLNTTEPFTIDQPWNYLGFDITINPSYCGTYYGPESFSLNLSIMK